MSIPFGISFDGEWIKKNTNRLRTITCSFKRKDEDYDDSCEMQTIYYDRDLKKFIAIDDWGGDVAFETWDDFINMLKEYDVECLTEMCINEQSKQFGFVDKRNAYLFCNQCERIISKKSRAEEN